MHLIITIIHFLRGFESYEPTGRNIIEYLRLTDWKPQGQKSARLRRKSAKKSVTN